MPGSPFFARIRADVLAMAASVPRGRVTSFAAIAAHIDVVPRHVAYILAQAAREGTAPEGWHRVVGQVGQLGTVAGQAALLAQDGIRLDAAGKVADFAGKFIAVAELGHGVPVQVRPADAGRRPTRRRSAALALALLLAWPASAAAPVLDTIWAGCTGGVTGGGSATRILADGRLVRLYQARAGAAWVTEDKGRDTELYAQVARALDEGGFAGLRGGPPGNLTCWLERVWATGRGWRVQWAGTEPPVDWPEAVRGAFTTLRGVGR